MSVSRKITTAVGDFTATYSDTGLAYLDFPGQPHPVPPGISDHTTANLDLWHSLTTSALHSILSRKHPAEFPPMDLSRGSDFQRSVWQLLLAIPLGYTRTYGELASDLGGLSASRAVGAACGANPIPVIIPCHRVLAANGRLGGFSGGLDWKRRLLQIEGVLLA